MDVRRTWNRLALSTALGSTLLLSATAPAGAQVVECRSWQPASAACGELRFNQAALPQTAAPGTAQSNPAVAAQGGTANRSTGAVIGNPGQNPAQTGPDTGGSGSGTGGEGGSATGVAPGSQASAAAQ